MTLQPISKLDETTRNRLLADEQRRFVIESLGTASRTVETTLHDLADRLARESDRTDGMDDAARRSLRCRLHHVHLPMLAEAGLLEYDGNTKRVRLGPSWVVAATAGSF